VHIPSTTQTTHRPLCPIFDSKYLRRLPLPVQNFLKEKGLPASVIVGGSAAVTSFVFVFLMGQNAQMAVVNLFGYVYPLIASIKAVKKEVICANALQSKFTLLPCRRKKMILFGSPIGYACDSPDVMQGLPHFFVDHFRAAQRHRVHYGSTFSLV
jgi:hypothetical protein